MEQLSRHIECLLLKHNCVIVPGIGGFVAQYAPAQYIESEQLFLPPYRNVGFNPLLTINDGLLTQSYMTAGGMSYTEGVKAIESEVARLREILDTIGKVEFFGIGTLLLTAEGTYDFEPISGGIASPSLYALDALSTPFIEQVETCEDAAKETTAPNPEDTAVQDDEPADNVYVLRLNKSVIHHIAAAIVAIFIYFAWAVPLGDSRQGDESLVLGTINKTQKTLASDPTGQAITHIAETIKEKRQDNAIIGSTKADKQQDKGETLQIAPKSDGQYTIVIISAVTKHNAERFVQTLKPDVKNHTSIIPMSNNSSQRIIYGSYRSEEEARSALRQLRSDDIFEQAWVMHL